MKHIEGGVTVPRGYKAAAALAGIKPTSSKKDCALVVSEVPAVTAGVFTTNLVQAAPVRWCREVCRSGKARAVFINSGNANACTGDQGYADTAATAGYVAEQLGMTAREVLVCSTGVIGVPLPMDKIRRGVELCAAGLSPDAGHDAALAIMTTDTVPKEVAVELQLDGGVVRLGGMAKGAGMISPHMATMIAVITTDAALSPDALSAALKRAVDRSFNRICVDNDMSTNDTVLVLANGAAGIKELLPGTKHFQLFEEALCEVCINLAQAIVRDGEGATKFVEIAVLGARDNEDAMRVARAVAQSQLCKTAFFGQDPNWGRIACAAGYSGATFDMNHLSVFLDNVCVMKNGMRADYQESDAAAVMKKPSFRIEIRLGNGTGEAVFWTSDLSAEYVRINADYRS